ncbi:hypothetical protein ACQYYH_28430, partial [Pseudomonas aeruginosa]
AGCSWHLLMGLIMRLGGVYETRGDSVVLEEDFPDIFDEEKVTPDQRIDELNLLYVAATRAKKVLVINSITQVVIQKSHAEAKRERKAAAGQRS